MERNEIVKALRCSAQIPSNEEQCAGCPYFVLEHPSEDDVKELGLEPEWQWKGCNVDRMALDAANLIVQQAMEIQELQNSLAVFGHVNAALRDKVPDWISVEEQLPDTNKSASGYEQVTVIATDGKRVRPMIYERACVRGKTKYRWKWIWDKIYDGNPITYWMPLPELPEELK